MLNMHKQTILLGVRSLPMWRIWRSSNSMVYVTNHSEEDIVLSCNMIIRWMHGGRDTTWTRTHLVSENAQSTVATWSLCWGCCVLSLQLSWSDSDTNLTCSCKEEDEKRKEWQLEVAVRLKLASKTSIIGFYRRRIEQRVATEVGQYFYNRAVTLTN